MIRSRIQLQLDQLSGPNLLTFCTELLNGKIIQNALLQLVIAEEEPSLLPVGHRIWEEGLVPRETRPDSSDHLEEG